MSSLFADFSDYFDLKWQIPLVILLILVIVGYVIYRRKQM